MVGVEKRKISCRKSRETVNNSGFGLWGNLGGICISNCIERFAKKFRMIILFHFGLVVFRIHFRESRKPIMFMVFESSGIIDPKWNRKSLRSCWAIPFSKCTVEMVLPDPHQTSNPHVFLDFAPMSICTTNRIICDIGKIWCWFLIRFCPSRQSVHPKWLGLKKERFPVGNLGKPWTTLVLDSGGI